MEFSHFRSRSFGLADPAIWEAARELPAHMWWETLTGSKFSTLAKVAARVLAHVSSSSVSERHWSASKFVIDSYRNKMGTGRAEKCIFVYSAQRMIAARQGHASGGSVPWTSILDDATGQDDEDIVDSDSEAQEDEDDNEETPDLQNFNLPPATGKLSRKEPAWNGNNVDRNVHDKLDGYNDAYSISDYRDAPLLTMNKILQPKIPELSTSERAEDIGAREKPASTDGSLYSVDLVAFAKAQTQHTQNTNKNIAAGLKKGASSSGAGLKQTALSGYVKSSPTGKFPVGGPGRIMKKQIKRGCSHLEAEGICSKGKRRRVIESDLDTDLDNDNDNDNDVSASCRSLKSQESADRC